MSAKGQNKWGFETMVNGLLKNNVDTINSVEVEAILKSPTKAVILDAREKDEYEVSHLKGAVQVGYNDFSIENLPEIDPADTIIVYCSIGKRSEDIGLRLKEAGFKNVLNLYGGIFDWTNRNLPVVDSKGIEVKRVHPYNSFWGIWVNNYERAYEPR